MVHAIEPPRTIHEPLCVDKRGVQHRIVKDVFIWDVLIVLTCSAGLAYDNKYDATMHTHARAHM